MRRLHDAGADFDPQGFDWSGALADPTGWSIVCHNDVGLSNLVFRDGVAVSIIDFEFAAPGEYDLAQLARLCVPIEDDFDQSHLGWQPADRSARLRLVADAYGLEEAGRARLLSALGDAINSIEVASQRVLHTDDANDFGMLDRTGGMAKYGRCRWWTHHRDEFASLH